MSATAGGSFHPAAAAKQEVSPKHADTRTTKQFADIKTPQRHDVLCGRGVTTNRHVGNESFRRLVGLNKELYVTSTKKQKMSISRSIVEAVRTLDPPGRFLDRNPDNGLWSDIGDRKAVEKTSQALRDGAVNLKKKLSERMFHAETYYTTSFNAGANPRLLRSSNGNNNLFPASPPPHNNTTTAPSKKKGRHRRAKSAPIPYMGDQPPPLAKKIRATEIKSCPSSNKHFIFPATPLSPLPSTHHHSSSQPCTPSDKHRLGWSNVNTIKYMTPQYNRQRYHTLSPNNNLALPPTYKEPSSRIIMGNGPPEPSPSTYYPPHHGVPFRPPRWSYGSSPRYPSPRFHHHHHDSQQQQQQQQQQQSSPYTTTNHPHPPPRFQSPTRAPPPPPNNNNDVGGGSNRNFLSPRRHIFGSPSSPSGGPWSNLRSPGYHPGSAPLRYRPDSGGPGGIIATEEGYWTQQQKPRSINGKENRSHNDCDVDLQLPILGRKKGNAPPSDIFQSSSIEPPRLLKNTFQREYYNHSGGERTKQYHTDAACFSVEERSKDSISSHQRLRPKSYKTRSNNDKSNDSSFSKSNDSSFSKSNDSSFSKGLFGFNTSIDTSFSSNNDESMEKRNLSLFSDDINSLSSPEKNCDGKSPKAAANKLFPDNNDNDDVPSKPAVGKFDKVFEYNETDDDCAEEKKVGDSAATVNDNEDNCSLSPLPYKSWEDPVDLLIKQEDSLKIPIF